MFDKHHHLNKIGIFIIWLIKRILMKEKPSFAPKLVDATVVTLITQSLNVTLQ